MNDSITPRKLLEKAGLPDSAGLLFMRADTMVPENQWNESLVRNGDRITLMSAIEGG